MFQVLDNNRPAEYPKQFNFCRSKFLGMSEAVYYARLWINNEMNNTLPTDWDGKPFEYNDAGDRIEIIEVRE